ncbi:hypothetical protein [Nocardia sp. NPDC046763]|uniref:hypothetical protein n=1 Tax=Nocardia sp. NPDC046763 TaxID=3155256 RepID=UPI0033E20FF6
MIHDYQERYLRDFFPGHFAVDDTVFVNAELVNSRQDPALAHLRAEHDASYAICTGIGAVGAIGLGVAVQRDSLSAGRV